MGDAMTDTLTFPDGYSYRIGDVRATHALAKRGIEWRGENGIVANFWSAGTRPEMFSIIIDETLYFLKHYPDLHHYAVGGWPNTVATAFILRKTDAGLVLELRDAMEITP